MSPLYHTTAFRQNCENMHNRRFHMDYSATARGPARTTDPDTDSETQFDRTRDAAFNQSDGPPLRAAALRLEKLVADRRNHMIDTHAELVRH